MRISSQRNSLLSVCATSILLLTTSQVVFAERNIVQDSEVGDSDTPAAAATQKLTIELSFVCKTYRSNFSE
jgi:hypothetical protein